jgi:hypothetical protein
MPRSFYDDNYGFWEDMDDPDNQAFYRETQKASVRKKCKGCGRMVKIRRDYAICNSCADRMERGGDLG